MFFVVCYNALKCTSALRAEINSADFTGNKQAIYNCLNISPTVTGQGDHKKCYNIGSRNRW